jgi:hypothetical protein
MRMFREPGDPYILSSEVFAVLRFCATDEPLFPNLTNLDLCHTVGEFIPFIPSFLSPRTTSISIAFTEYKPPKVVFVASMLTAFPTLCPNLQTIYLHSLPRDPIITAAVSKFLLTTNRGALRQFYADSPLTEEAREVIYTLPNLCGLFVVVEESTSLPTMALPNLTDMYIEYDRDRGWLEGFRGATLGKLDSITFFATSGSAQIGDFLQEFQSAALTTSAQNTLSEFHFRTSHSWNPSYSSLLAFKQLTELEIEFSCHEGCSSRVDDDVIISLAQAMPKLKILQLGKPPCGTPTGVTFKGIIALACRCPQLSRLCIHFRTDSLIEATAIGEPPPPSNRAASIPQTNCVLTDLQVGDIPISKGSALVVALTILKVFPHIFKIEYDNPEWGTVADAIERFKSIGVHVRHTSKMHLPRLR